jgi:PPOX class probable F420-dependent enzyme
MTAPGTPPQQPETGATSGRSGAATTPSAEALAVVRQLAAAERGLAVVATVRRDGSIQASVVNAGLLEHPVTGQPVVAFVARGESVKLKLLRRSPRATVVFRAGPRWATVEGRATLIGPDDPLAGFPPEHVPPLLRQIFTAAGGTHDNWAEYDRVMAEERRTAVLVELERVYWQRPAASD